MIPPYTLLGQQAKARDLSGLQQTLDQEIVPYQQVDPQGDDGWRLRVIPNLWATWFSTTDSMDPAIALALLEAQPVGVSGVDLSKSLGMIVRQHPALHAVLPKVLRHVNPGFDWAQALREAVEQGALVAVQALMTPEQVRADHGHLVWFAAKTAPESRVIEMLLPHADLADVVAHHAGQQWEAWDRLAQLAPENLRTRWLTDHPGKFPLTEDLQRAVTRKAALQARSVSPSTRPRFRA